MQSSQPAIKYQSIGNSTIQYLDYKGNGPALLLLHATGFLPWTWHPVARRLKEKFRVIAPYFCDHREADPHMGGLGWLSLAEDLTHFCAALSLEAPYLIGHSMGATVVTLAHAAHGTPAAGVVLIEPIFLPETLYQSRLTVEQHPLAAKAIKRRNTWTDRDEAITDFKRKPFFQSWDDEVLSLYVTHGITDNTAGGLELTCSPKREASLFMGSMQHDPWPHLPAIACPTLVLEGENSENRPWIDLRKAANLIPRGQYRMVHNAGHLIPMEKPAEIADIIDTFFRQEEAA